jgi:SAM-dependent methyltransferase
MTDADDAFYTRLFTKNPTWSTPYPNVEEAQRAARILPLLTRAATRHDAAVSPEMRILDLGCGRGWLTYLASAYGTCMGIDPVRPVIESARAHFPHLSFEVGTATDLLQAGQAGAYDLVLASEVIEHAPLGEQDRFVGEIRELLKPAGQALITTDRGEIYERWRQAGRTHQPEENWLTERQVRELFLRHGFRVAGFDRAYYATPDLSAVHRLIESSRLQRALSAARQRWLLDSVQFLAAGCQLWLFTRDG